MCVYVCVCVYMYVCMCVYALGHDLGLCLSHRTPFAVHAGTIVYHVCILCLLQTQSYCYGYVHHTSYIIHHTSYIIHHTSYIIHHTSYICLTYIHHQHTSMHTHTHTRTESSRWKREQEQKAKTIMDLVELLIQNEPHMPVHIRSTLKGVQHDLRRFAIGADNFFGYVCM